MTEATGEGDQKPRYSFRATSRSARDRGRAVRLDFHDEEIRVYRLHLHYLRESEWSLHRHIQYSDVQGCEYLAPKVENGSTLGGFAWAKVPAEIELSVRGSDARLDRHGGGASWMPERFRVRGLDMSEGAFKEAYAWLLAKLQRGPAS